MGTILVCNHKGGVGKTSIVLHLASVLAQQRRPVLAVDTDPQGSLTQWFARSKAEGWAFLPEVFMLRGEEFLRRRESLEVRYPTILVDTPPTFSPAVVALAEDAVRVLVPVTPGGFELDALQTTLGMGGRERMRFVLNRADNGKVCRAVREHLEALGPVSVVRNYAVYREASLAGGSVLELEPRSKAAADIRQLADEVLS